VAGVQQSIFELRQKRGGSVTVERTARRAASARKSGASLTPGHHHYQMEYRRPTITAALKTMVAIPATSMLSIRLGYDAMCQCQRVLPLLDFDHKGFRSIALLAIEGPQVVALRTGADAR
jgi:hypothetical protein